MGKMNSKGDGEGEGNTKRVMRMWRTLSFICGKYTYICHEAEGILFGCEEGEPEGGIGSRVW